METPVTIYDENGIKVAGHRTSYKHGGIFFVDIIPGKYSAKVLARTSSTFLAKDNLVVEESGSASFEAKFGRISVGVLDGAGNGIRSSVSIYDENNIGVAGGKIDYWHPWYWADVIPGTYKIVVREWYGKWEWHRYVVISPEGSAGGVFGPPDLSVSSSDISFSVEPIPEGETINISATIHNVGGSDVAGASVSFYDGDPVNGILIDTLNTGPITAGGSETINASWNATPSGTHEIHVVLDPDDAINEIREDNNHAWAEVEVTVSNVAPVAYIDSITPSPAVDGEIVTFIGHGTDEDGIVTGYNWRSDVNGDLSTQASFSNSVLSVGTHTIYFKVQDDDGVWSEEVSLELEVKEAKPDLKISRGDVTFSTSEAIIGTTIRVMATVHNIGTADAGSFKVRFEYSPNIPFASSPDEVVVPSLAESASTTVGADFKIIRDIEKYTIKVIVDPEEGI
jgi:hypothetical protein